MPALEWYNPIPDTYDPFLQKTQWVESLPNVVMPVSKNIVNVAGDLYTWAQMAAKGVTVLSKFSLGEPQIAPIADSLKSAGKTLDDVPRPEHFGFTTAPGGGSPNGQWLVDGNGTQYNSGYYPNGPRSEADAYEAAGGTNIEHRVSILETMEGESWVSPDAPAWKGWHRRVAERRQEYWGNKGMQHLYCANYYTPSPFNWWNLTKALSKESFMQNYNKPISQWDSPQHNNLYINGRSLSVTNLICDGIYLEPPNTPQSVVKSIWRSQLTKKMGKHFGVYIAKTWEWRPNNYCSTVYRQADYPSKWGVYFRAEKIDLPPELMIAFTLVGSIFGDIVHEWANGGGSSVASVAVNRKDTGWDATDKFFPNQYDSSGDDTGRYEHVLQENPRVISRLANDFPYYATGNQKVLAKNGANYMMIAANMYARTFGQTEGGVQQPLEYRIDGGAWRSAKSTIAEAALDSYFDDSYFVFCERKNGKISIGAYNQAGSDMLKHSMDIKNPVTGTIYNATVVAGAFYAATVDE